MQKAPITVPDEPELQDYFLIFREVIQHKYNN
jgi:hypothetical protein